MSGNHQRLVAGTILALGSAALLAAAAGATSSAAHPPSDKGLSCSLGVERRGGTIILEPQVFTERRIDGDYDLRVRGGGAAGRADISQGGSFSARAGTDTVLGSVSLSAGATYDARLEVEANGTRVVCEERVGR